ncbi:MAG: ATP-binding protein [Candidatus Aminicenantes bacterium]|jgi:signal transduction histidine kinase
MLDGAVFSKRGSATPTYSRSARCRSFGASSQKFSEFFVARKFITFSPGGWLKKEKVELSHILKNARDSESLKITVKDNGIGILPGNIEKVFDPYFTTRDKADQKGIGLGLTLCYSIVKKHNGHIAVESEPGKGTIFTLYLPAFKEI